jgi:hypothetical protein
LSGGVTPCVSSSRDTKSRKTTGPPSVTNQTPPAGATVAPEPKPLDRVVDVRGGGEVVSAADPAEAARAHGADDGRQQGRIASSPDEARPDHDRLRLSPFGARTRCSALAFMAG